MADIKPSELKALLTLLDDQDEEVFQNVQDRLEGYGTAVVPSLMEAWETTPNVLLQDRIEFVIHNIQLHDSLAAFKNWLQTPDLDILTGALIVARHRYPELNEHLIWNKIEQLKRDLWVETRGFNSPIEKINLFNHVFYRQWEFNIKDDIEEGSSQYFFLNRVLESRRGNDISLGILYLGIARQMGLPLYGVNIPDNFCLAFKREPINEDQVQAMERNPQYGILFYINPRNKGLIFTRHELRQHLKTMPYEETDEPILPLHNRQVIQLMIETLQSFYEIQGEMRSAADLEAYLDLLD